MKWLNYHHLYYFWTVARLNSFTKAAEELRIAQSAVSLQVAQLEDFLGKTLIDRSTSKKLTLTEEGQLVFFQAEDIFRQGRELVQSLSEDSLQSALRFGAMGSLSKNLQIRLLRPLLESQDFELSVDVGDAETLLARLHKFHLDAILCDVPYAHSEGEPLIQRQVAREPFCLVAKKGSMSLADRLARGGIYLPARSNPATSEIQSFLEHHHRSVKIQGYIDDIALLRLLANETDSVVAIPRVGVEMDLKEKKLIVLHQFKGLYQKFYLVLRQKGNRSKTILKLLHQS